MPTVLITGASRGIGLEFARQYAADGWTVIAACRAPTAALAALGVRVESLEVADAASINALGQRLAATPIDLLINNAGVYGDRDKQAFATAEAEEWLAVMRVNVAGPLLLTRALLPSLEAAGTATVATLSSIMGSVELTKSGGSYLYRSSKAAVNMVIRGMAAELGPKGLTFLALHPGWVQTDMGGPEAAITPGESVSGLRAVIARATPADNGRFFDFSGEELPW